MAWWTIGAGEAVASGLAVTAAVVLAALLAQFVYTSYQTWADDFGERVERFDPRSPSNKKMVELEKDAVASDKIVDAARRLKRGSVIDRLQKDVSSRPAPAPEVVARRGRRGSCIKMLDAEGKQVLDTSRAESLDMDHVFLKFWDYMWGLLVVGTCAQLLWFGGIVHLLIRQRLERLGWARPKPHDPELVVGKLLLESIGEQLHFVKLSNEDGRKVANFVWLNLPMLDNDGNFANAELFTVNVDVETKRMVAAKLDKDELSAKDAMILIWFHTIFAGHVKLHSFANWGVNCYGDVPAYVRKMSIVTVIYNYFGFSVFARLCKQWFSWGWADKNWADVVQVIRQGVGEPVKEHGALQKLMPYSEINAFIIKLRNYFLNLFAKEKDNFLGIDGEAYFIGSVMHSLDHTLMGWNLEDPLWLDIKSEKFKLMAQFGRFVRVGFVEDLPLISLWLNKRYRTAPGRFYQNVYRHASKLNQRFADHMDTCIVK